MNKIKQCIRRVFWMYVVMFTWLVGTIVFITLDTNTMTNSYNPRTKKANTAIVRGEIKDYKGNVLVESIPDGDTYNRNYVYGKVFSHIIGYSKLGSAGVEAKYNFELTNVRFEIIERFKNILLGTQLQGNNIALTLDKDIQNKAYELLGNQKGSIVVMEPSTGKILSMVSYPNFNPNTLDKDWEKLKSDEENSPLLNRAIQGLYPPGSTYKIITAAAVIENNESWKNFSYECTGEEHFVDKRIRCYNSTKHGLVNLKEAFAVSCNTTFSNLGKNIGANILKSVSERAGFNSSIEFPLEYRQSTFLLTENSTESEVVETSIGQGRTLSTPLQMARIVSAVANDGILMKPYLLDRIEDNEGNTIKKYMPEKELDMFSSQVSQELVDMMVEVVNSGTGTSAGIKNVTVAGKTGTAEIAGGEPHAWFVGFAPAENPKVAVVVLLEGGGVGGSSASPIAREIIKAVLKD